MIDIVIVIALIVCTVLGWRRGLIRTLAELAAVVLALGLSAQAAKTAAPKIVDQYLRPTTHAAIEQRAEEIAREADETTHENLSKLMEAIPNSFIRGKALDTVDSMFAGGRVMGASTAEPLAKLGKELADHVLDTLVKDLIQSILCAMLFMVLSVALRWAAKVLRLVEKLPGIHELNGFGGALVGLGKGLVLACLAVWVLTKIGMITPEAAKNSMILGLLPGWISGAGK